MDQAARVLSVDALKDFHVALDKFVERASAALLAVDMGSRKNLEWITHDQQAYWKRELRQRAEEVSQAKIELNRLKISRTADHKPDTIEQEKRLREAQHRLREAEEKSAAVRKWGRIVEKAFEEYLGKARRLQVLLEGEPPPAVASLEKSINALEAYVEVKPIRLESEV